MDPTHFASFLAATNVSCGGTETCLISLMAVTAVHLILAYSNKNEEERVRAAKQESSAEESDDQDDGEDDR